MAETIEKIKLMADTPSDITDEELERYNIDMPCVPIAIDGQSYIERQSFSNHEFYTVLENAQEIPVTSRVPTQEFLACYKKAYEQGYTSIICVTINASGSGTNMSAHQAKEEFFRKNSEAKDKVEINIIDSKTYSAGYGYPVVQAAKMALNGHGTAEILDYLNHWFSRVEILLGCYSLKYAKKSGRITAAAAFVGDVLGVRPVILMIDGQTKTIDKVRGDKNLVPKLVETYLKRRESKEAPVAIAHGKDINTALELQALLEKETGRQVPMYAVGASIAINAGPDIVAIVLHSGAR